YSEHGYRKFTPSSIFSTFDLQTQYSKHKKTFDRLKELHQKSNPDNIGSYLMLILDQANTNRIYPAGWRADMKEPVKLSNGTSTTNAQEIVQELREGKLPESDKIQFV